MFAINKLDKEALTSYNPLEPNGQALLSAAELVTLHNFARGNLGPNRVNFGLTSEGAVNE